MALPIPPARTSAQSPSALALFLAALLAFQFPPQACARDDGSAPPVAPVVLAPAAPAVNPTATPRRPAVKPRIDREELLGHIQFLASEELRGREAGTPDQLKAAQYIAAEFGRYGLEPLGDEKDGKRSFLQEFSLAESRGAAPETALTLTADGKETVFELKKQFAPFPAGMEKARAEGGVVFAGYGIHAPELEYDDFQGVDLEGKWALLLRYEPGEKDPKSKFDGLRPSAHAALAAKIQHCVKRKAVGVLVVTGPAGREQEPERLTNSSGTLLGHFAVPVFQITRAVADAILAPSDQTLEKLQSKIEKGVAPHSCLLQEIKLTGVSALLLDQSTTSNVIARLEGRDERLKHEYVLLGAHSDHVGLGRSGSLLGDAGKGKIHPGADDNASGTSGMLEIAQCLAALPPAERPRRSILFVAFSGEEKGLLGSVHYVQNPAVGLKATIAMLNLDMIGRSENGAVQVSGVGTAKGFKALVQKHVRDPQLKLFLGSSGDGPSDHATFHAKGLPVLFFFTGIHPDYHRPSDTWEKINAPVAEAVAVLVRDVLVEIAGLDVRPEPVPSTSRGYLGVGPDRVAMATAAGYPVGSVEPQSPAAQAGVQVGDLIVMFNGQRISQAMDLSMALLELGPGDLAEISVKRGTETRTLQTHLGLRPGAQKKPESSAKP